MLLLLSLLVNSLVYFAAGDDVLLKPIKQGKQDVGIMMIQGALITPTQYVPLMKALQQASEYTLWIGIPEFSIDVAEPLVLKKGIDQMMSAMEKAGMKNKTFFIAGHSQGGATLQAFVKSNSQGVTGMILMGSFITRDNYNTSYPVPTLTIGGELDGLTRVTRIMEGFYHQIIHSKDDDPIMRSPIVVIKGLSHMQFASGDPPLLVKYRDLKPEISYDEAHGAIANISASFVTLQLTGNSHSYDSVQNAVNKTRQYLQPLLTAYQMEGSAHFKPPCNNDPPSPRCTSGCPWTSMTAQDIMGGLTPGVVNDKDEFHPVYQIPVHLPKIDNNCSTFSSQCVLKTHTVSQCVYEELDKLDTAFFANSAEEIRCKMSSRQSIMKAAGMKDVDFNKTDGSSICKVINQASYSYALNISSKTALERYKKLGQELTFGDDLGPYNAGPLWIWDPLKYKTVTNSDGKKVIEIRSPMMRTPTDYPVELAAGFHYCKLLSPARAIEWIYVDGLRLYDSLNNSTNYSRP